MRKLNNDDLTREVDLTAKKMRDKKERQEKEAAPKILIQESNKSVSFNESFLVPSGRLSADAPRSYHEIVESMPFKDSKVIKKEMELRDLTIIGLR